MPKVTKDNPTNKRVRVRSKPQSIECVCDVKECGHKFEIPILDLLRKQWCPYCAKKRLCDKLECLICYNRSFASNKRAGAWHFLKNSSMPREYFKTSGKKIWFICDNKECNHEFESRLSDITTDNTWCPYCSNRRLCTDDKCVVCFAKSFASHPRAEYWSDKNKESPRSIYKGSHKKYWFTCENNHTTAMLLHSISRANTWCC